MGSSSHTSKIKRGKDAVALDIIAYGFCGIIALVCLVPFIMIVSGSFSSESAIIQNGFSLLPQDFSLEAYKTVFKDPMVVFRAYGTTIGLTIVGTVLGLLLQTMTAQALCSRWRRGHGRNWCSERYDQPLVINLPILRPAGRRARLSLLLLYHFVFRRSCSVLRTDDTDPESAGQLPCTAPSAAVQRIQPSDHEELHRGTSGFSD